MKQAYQRPQTAPYPLAAGPLLAASDPTKVNTNKPPEAVNITDKISGTDYFKNILQTGGDAGEDVTPTAKTNPWEN